MAKRLESARVYPLIGNRELRIILRDTLVPEDPYINLARAKALSVRTGETYNVPRVSRYIKDYLIRTNVTI